MDFAWSDDEETDEVLMEVSQQLEEKDIVASQPNGLPPEAYHLSHFVCTGKDTPNASFHSISFMENNDLALISSSRRVNVEEFAVFNLTTCQDVFLERNLFPALFLMARTTAMELKCGKKLPRGVPESNFEKRMHITHLLHYTRCCSHLIAQEELLRNLRVLEYILEAESSIPSQNILPTIYSNATSATHHFFHGYLEWRWLHLTILVRKHQENTLESDFRQCQSWQRILDVVNLYIFDLLRISLNKFNSLKLQDILGATPFSCTCVRESWLLVISLLEMFRERISFWDIFSSAVTCLFCPSSCEKIAKVRSGPGKCENSHIFTIWMMLHLVGFQEKGIPQSTLQDVDLLNRSVKFFFAEDPSELEVRVAIRLVASLILDSWTSAIDVIVQFWEHFHKKINTNFYIASDGMNSLLVANDSAMSYLKAARLHLDTPIKSIPSTQTSFVTFCQIIGHFLKRFGQSDFMKSFQKITGRIFIKFTTKKWLSMNETGIHNLISLLVILASVGDEKIVERVENICLLIPLQDLPTARQSAASKGLIALLILAFRHSRQSLYPRKLIMKLNLDRDGNSCLESVTKVFAHGMCDIFTESEHFSSKEHILVTPWLPKYLKSCSENDREFLLNQLNKALVKIQHILSRGDESESLQELLRVFFYRVLPYVKEEYENSEGVLWLPELTGNLCLAASGQNGLPKIEDLFCSFMEMNCKNTKCLFTLFSMIATSDKVSAVNPSLLIHHWIRCMIFCSSASSEDLRQATEAIASLPELQEVCAISREEFLASREPFYAFLFGIGQKYQQLDDLHVLRDQMALSNKFHNYIKSFEKWALQGLDTQEGANNVYRTIAVIVLHCPQIVYVKMKSDCFLKIVVSEFILPASLKLGKTQSINVIKAMMKIFPVFLEGIAKLDFKSDSYLTFVISNMILHWIPQFKTATNAHLAAKPLVKCFSSKSQDMSRFILEKYCECFLPQTPRKGTSHASLAINVLKEIFSQTSSSEGIFQLLLEVTCVPLMDHVLMCDEFAPGKKLVLELLEFVFKSEAYKKEAKYRQMIVENLKRLTTTKLSFQTSAYFLFMLKMATVNPMAVQDLLPFLKDQIIDVEFRRGSGRDARLRQQLNSLEDAVMAKKGNC
ncbi:protein MMS22-like [Phlebotomus argentipes]|uniref:protein MMS22-like n=1 Tax=Phlebotomus argentipes TaxID=94469 RepID=UPI002892A0AA|nr:protein MMS22-like [Phlebotomus argentipes]